MAGYITPIIPDILCNQMVNKSTMAAVRKNKNQNGAVNSAAALQERKKLRRGIILLSCMFVLLLALGGLFWWLSCSLFEKNKRFTVREVAVSSNGFWNTNEESRRALVNKLNIHINQDNIFELDLKKMRQELRSFANVADAQLELQLPDRLVINIEERVPRAVLGSPRYRRVVDANAVVMDAAQCMKHSDLPVIIGMRTPPQQIKPGIMLSELHQALALLMAMERFQCFKAEMVKIGSNNELVLTVKYLLPGRALTYYVTMPTGDYPQLLTILSSVIEEALGQRNTMNVLNMNFEGKVVFSR